MLMVCPNCHSHEIIEVQGQHFCINCGQMVPDPPQPQPTDPTSSTVAVQENGLPEGVKILPVGPASAQPEIKSLVKPRTRITENEASTDAGAKPEAKKGSAISAVAAKIKKRKPGRPKATRLDVPRAIAAQAPAAPLPTAPKIAAVTPLANPKPATNRVRRMSDIAPRRPAPTSSSPTSTLSSASPRSEATPAAISANPSLANTNPAPAGPKPPSHLANHAVAAPTKPARHKAKHEVHKVGVPPLHYGAVIAFSLRARVRPRLVALATLASLSFAAAIAYGTWLLLTTGLPHLAERLAHSSRSLLLETTLLAALYYVGRSIGQAAITFGVAREADHRPVPLTRQIGVGINTFGRRLLLDIGFALGEVGLLALVAGLMLTGGEDWPINPQLHLAIIFCAFLALLYLLTALALTRGLAGVALTLTNRNPWATTKLGWRLFSHRFELLGLRFAALALELLLAVPPAALAGAFIVSAPAPWHLAVVAAVAVLAWLAGALFGAGTATWWTALYRRLVLADRPAEAITLLSARKAQDANRGSLSLIISLSTLLAATAVALPLINK